MICQYCGHKLTDGKCTYPACPGRLIVHKFSLPDGKLVECGKRYDAVWRAPDKLWKAVTGIKDGSGLFCPSCFTAIAQGKGISVYWDACESEAWDKVAPVAQDDCIERIISYVDEYINDQIDRVVLKSEIGLVLNDIFFSYLVPADLTDALVEAAEEVLKELEDAHHQDIVSSRTTKALEAALAALKAMEG